MLNHLHIRHFAIIDETELELGAGMTALTGETGAGKSILLDALGQVLGNRASAELIAQGAMRAEITASFDLEYLPAVKQWLADNDLDDNDIDDDHQCIVRRVLSKNGKNRNTINGRPVSGQMQRELGQQLISIHGQNEHQLLGKAGEQRLLLDNASKSELPVKVRTAFMQWRNAKQQLDDAEATGIDRQNRIDLLQFQLQEFDALELGGTSPEEIVSEHGILANTDKVQQWCNDVLSTLQSEHAVEDKLNAALPALNQLVGIDESLRESLDLVESAQIQIQEATSLIRHYASNMEHDESRLSWLDEKLSTLHRLAKKHQVAINQLDDIEQELRNELDSYTAPESHIEQLQREVDARLVVYQENAKKLTNLRKRTAKTLSQTVTASMQTLAMKGGQFSIDISTDKQAISAHGQDSVTFTVSPNPGKKPGPLAKIASGGELSRISLAIQLAIVGSNTVPTLIFDEVDAGVGGATAETVGRLLRQVGHSAQVLCVTHLPQVAAQAHQHMRVSKTNESGTTQTTLAALNKTETRDEIARMLGGAKITKKTRQHAQEMLESAGSQ